MARVSWHEVTVLPSDPRSNGIDEGYIAKGPVFRTGEAGIPLSPEFFAHLMENGTETLRIVTNRDTDGERMKMLYDELRRLPTARSGMKIKSEELVQARELLNGFPYGDFSQFSRLMREREKEEADRIAEEFGIRIERETIILSHRPRPASGHLIVTDIVDRSASEISEMSHSTPAFSFIVQLPAQFLGHQKNEIAAIEKIADLRTSLPSCTIAEMKMQALFKEIWDSKISSRARAKAKA